MAGRGEWRCREPSGKMVGRIIIITRWAKRSAWVDRAGRTDELNYGGPV